MNYLENIFLHCLKGIVDNKLGIIEEEKKVDYRKLPYIKINKIKAEHTEPVLTAKQEAKAKYRWRVRKENINKVKLPVFCSFEMNDGRPRRLGVLVNDFYKGDSDIPSGTGISLYEIDRQTNLIVGDRIDSMCNSNLKSALATLIEMYKINIGKVEINFYE
jgi:hypothetical protein